jgi:hypothetical protein
MIHCKRYLATAGLLYYPAMSMGDFVGIFDTAEEAMSAGMDKSDGEWVCVFDLLNEKVVAVADWDFQAKKYIVNMAQPGSC